MNATRAAATALALGIAGTLGFPHYGSAQTVLAHRGSEVYAVLGQTLSSKSNHDGDTFVLAEKETFFHHNPALKGATIDGHVENVSPASPTHKATMNVILDDIVLPDGSKAPIHATIVDLKTFEPKTHKLRDAGIIVGSAVAGHVVSGKTGKKGGTLVGAVAGAAIVSGLKSDVVVKKGTVVRLRLLDDVGTGTGT
ncbi:MAG: hypothetical protein ACREM8_03205 [Vulcanimicrobiaceae bacterium]